MTYYSNNFYWNNNFQQQGALNGRLYYRMSKYQFEIGGGLFRNTNYVYFNGTQMIQDNRANQGVMGYIQKDFRFKHVLFQNKITFQYVFNNDSVITLPNWFSAHSLSYQNSVFNNALKYQIGIDVYYNSAYYANAYAPSLGQFYVQNQTKIGNYPYLDVFLNLKISRARIFIKYENIDAFLGEFQNSYFRYYYAPHYPWNDGALKMGVLWRFFD